MNWTILIVWYLLGVISYIYFLRVEQDISLFDFMVGLLVGLLGGVVPVLIFFINYSDKVIIKRRKQ